jgi:hypothetical protein
MIAISADGVPIAYTVLGTGMPLVLLHGFSETGKPATSIASFAQDGAWC